MSGIIEPDGADGEGQTVWVLARGKHTGKTLREVAQDHPDYLGWMRREVEDLTDEQKREIERIAAEEDVDLYPSEARPWDDLD